jgi:hypothetical protein
VQERLAGVKAVWAHQHPIRPSELDSLRRTAWDMFDHGFSSYLRHAYPKVGGWMGEGSGGLGDGCSSSSSGSSSTTLCVHVLPWLTARATTGLATR